MGWMSRGVRVGIAAGLVLAACGDDQDALPVAIAFPADVTPALDTPTVTVQFTPPSNFRQDPRPSDAIQDYGRANGLYVFERWLVSDDATMASFSVQTNPGEESPLLSCLEFSDSITTDALTWYLWDRRSVEPTGTPPNMAMAVTTDYLYMVSGTRAPMQAVIDGLTIER